MNTINGKVRGKGNVPISIQKEIKKEGEGNCRVSFYVHHLTFEEIDYVEKALDGIIHNVLVMRGEMLESITFCPFCGENDAQKLPTESAKYEWYSCRKCNRIFGYNEREHE